MALTSEQREELRARLLREQVAKAEGALAAAIDALDLVELHARNAQSLVGGVTGREKIDRAMIDAIDKVKESRVAAWGVLGALHREAI